MTLSQRVNNIEQLIKFIAEIKENIRFSLKPLPKIQSELLKNPQYKLLCNNFEGFSKSDSKEALEFLNGLGKTDTLGQLTYCDYYIKRFESIKSTASKERSEKAKLYEVLGICAGIAAAIMII